MPHVDYTLAELCITACAQAWRGDGEIVASGMGLIPAIAAGLARLTFSPDLLVDDGEACMVSEPLPSGRRNDDQRKVESWLPYRHYFDLVWSGKRHAMMMPVQIDRFGNVNISCIGDWHKPKTQLLGVRGIPGNTLNHPCSYFITNHSPRSFVGRVDMSSGAGYDAQRWAPGVKRDFHDLRCVVTNLAVLDFNGPDHVMRLRTVHPGVTREEVQKQTGFELAVADGLGETPVPTREELRLIREILDPDNRRASVFKT